jgi:EAL domain-containing protein (putative c-di-GMP-specific phosphodiesterase class I)
MDYNYFVYCFKGESLMEILSKKIMPYFQPIVSIDTGSIYGYEVLGRYADNDGKIKSLGGFFSNKNVSNEEMLEVDRRIREEALKKFSEDGAGKRLFINMRLAWLSKFAANPSEMPTIKWAEQYGIDLSRIIIEITEEEFNESNAAFITALSYYKSVGCKIAVDDYGSCCSNIDRLADLCPDIIKIDMKYVQKSENFYQFREYLRTISDFAQKLGIEVVYEGIETQNQLDNCISAKGRFYQGFLLSEPLPSMKNALFNEQVFKHSMFKSVAECQKSITKSIALKNSLDYIIDQYFEEKPYDEKLHEIDEYFSELCLQMPSCVKRIYLCNKFGYQVSSNMEKGTDTIELCDYKNRNWAWRGYFQSALTAISFGQKSYITKSYRDATTKEKIYTYARQVKPDVLMFVDIMRDEL